jgi:drug/metabolite transporter (DMT)-like permease
MSNAFGAAFWGLLSALSWGGGDFSGGLATRRSTPFIVILVSQLFSTPLLVALGLIFSEPLPDSESIGWGILAGAAGVTGLLALYFGLSRAQMGIIAPLSALVTGIIPVIVSIVLEGPPSTRTMVGFGLALAAVWLVSGTDRGVRLELDILILPIIAGLGFGLFFVFIDQMVTDGVFLPLVAARLTSLSILFGYIRLRHRPFIVSRSLLPLMGLSGFLDTGGNVFFAFATQVGRLDISSVLSSLYPAATVVMAWFILKERLTRQQWIGVVVALVAVALIAA